MKKSYFFLLIIGILASFAISSTAITVIEHVTCGTVSGELTLTANISTSEDVCFTFENGATLNGAGFSIIYTGTNPEATALLFSDASSSSATNLALVGYKGNSVTLEGSESIELFNLTIDSEGKNGILISTSMNSHINHNIITITADSGSTGITLSRSEETIIANSEINVVANQSSGVEIEGNNNHITNSFVSVSGVDSVGITLIDDSEGNTVTNTDIISEDSYEIREDNPEVFSNSIYYDNEFGSVLWEGADLTVDGDLVFDDSVRINENLFGTTTSVFTEFFSLPAQVTLYDLPFPQVDFIYGSFEDDVRSQEEFLYSGGFEYCSEELIAEGFCDFSLWNYSDGMLNFEISSPGVYSAGVFASETSCGLVETNLTLTADIETEQTICFLIYSHNQQLNGNGHSITSTSSDNTGVLVARDAEFATLKNITFNNFLTGVNLFQTKGSVVDNVIVNSSLVSGSTGISINNSFETPSTNTLLNIKVLAENAIVDPSPLGSNILQFTSDYGSIYWESENLNFVTEGGLTRIIYGETILIDENLVVIDPDLAETFPEDAPEVVMKNTDIFQPVNYIALAADGIYTDRNSLLWNSVDCAENCPLRSSFDVEEVIFFPTQFGSFTLAYDDDTAPVVTGLTTNPESIENDGSEQEVNIGFESNEYPLEVTFTVVTLEGTIYDVSSHLINSSADLPLTITLPAGMETGVHGLYMNARDYTNDSTDYFVSKVNVDDITPPALSEITLEQVYFTTTDITLPISFESSEFPLELFFILTDSNGNSTENDYGSVTSGITEPTFAALADGVYAVKMNATDADGNTIEVSVGTVYINTHTNPTDVVISTTPELPFTNQQAEQTITIDLENATFPDNETHFVLTVTLVNSSNETLKEEVTFIMNSSELPSEFTVPAALPVGEYEFIVSINFAEAFTNTITVEAASSSDSGSSSSGGGSGGGGGGSSGGGGSIPSSAATTTDDSPQSDTTNDVSSTGQNFNQADEQNAENEETTSGNLITGAVTGLGPAAKISIPLAVVVVLLLAGLSAYAWKKKK